jgi:hypothetical protein
VSPLDGLRAQLSATGRALRNRDLSRLLFAWGVWVTADWSLLITVSFLALDAGGPGAVGLVGAARLLPAALLGAPASVLTDRVSRSRLLCVVYLGWSLLAALLVWCALVDPLPGRRLRRTTRILVALLVLGAGTLLSDVLLFSFHPLYPAYAEQADRLFSLSPHRDQQLAGLVMMVEQLLALGTCAFLLLRPTLRVRGARLARQSA